MVITAQHYGLLLRPPRVLAHVLAAPGLWNIALDRDLLDNLHILITVKQKLIG